MGTRFLSANLGRSIQQDPIGDDINWYAYAANNPLVFIDPEGLLRWRDVGDWYMGGMGGASDWVDRHILGGTTSRFGCVSGLYDAGMASGWDVAGAGAAWGGRLALAGYIGGKGGVAAGRAAWRGGRGAWRGLADWVGPRLPKRLEHVGGWEAKLTRNFRIGWHRMPRHIRRWGGRNLPHYHRRYRGPGGGIGRHRPWEGW